eukprot:Pgem_evm1s12391
MMYYIKIITLSIAFCELAEVNAKSIVTVQNDVNVGVQGINSGPDDQNVLNFPDVPRVQGVQEEPDDSDMVVGVQDEARVSVQVQGGVDGIASVSNSGADDQNDFNFPDVPRIQGVQEETDGSDMVVSVQDDSRVSVQVQGGVGRIVSVSDTGAGVPGIPGIQFSVSNTGTEDQHVQVEAEDEAEDDGLDVGTLVCCAHSMKT